MVAEATGENKRNKDRINPTSVCLKDNKDLPLGFISGIHHDALALLYRAATQVCSARFYFYL